MRFKRLSLQDFRNITFQTLDFESANTFLLGPNGQGKTNLLEALGMVTALKSFRTQDTKTLIRHTSKEAQIRFEIDHEKDGDVDLLVKLRSEGKEVYWNGERIKKISELVGRLPAVVLSSEDMQLLRGSPGMRRRFMDLTLAAMDSAYYSALRRYHNALQQRNTLLRQKSQNIDEMLNAYEAVMSQESQILYEKRVQGLAQLTQSLLESYAAISGIDEEPELIYKADCSADWSRVLKESRTRDKILGATQRGVHRDDLVFKLKRKGAKDFSSEGQQRGLVLALKLAQITYFSQQSGLRPVVLADDVLGQLDESRRAGFWNYVGNELQIIATGTDLPDFNIGQQWECFNVSAGDFSNALNHAPLEV